jgi:transcriptional regulator with XRE-family HTH domain
MTNKGARLLRAWRKRLKLTQLEAAQHIGIALSTLQHYEQGVSWPQRDNALKLKDKASVPVEAWPTKDERAAV